MPIRRRTLLGVATAAAVDAAWGQSAHVHHHPELPVLAPSAEPYARLQGGQPHHLTADQTAQRSVDSPAPKGAAGRWVPKAALPIPRSEMAWADKLVRDFGPRLSSYLSDTGPRLDIEKLLQEAAGDALGVHLDDAKRSFQGLGVAAVDRLATFDDGGQTRQRIG